MKQDLTGRDDSKAHALGDTAKFIEPETKLLIVDANGKELDITGVTYMMGGGTLVVTLKQRRNVQPGRRLERTYQVQYGQYKGEKGYVVVSSGPNALSKERKVWFTTDSKGDAMDKADDMNREEAGA